MALPVLYRPAPTNSLTDLYVTLDDWSATAVDAQGTEWWLSTVDGWAGSPEVRLTGVDRPQDHGQFDGPTWFGSRVITLAGTAIALDKPSANVARDIISSLCWDPSQLYTMTVTEPGRPDRRCSVRLTAPSKVSAVNEVAFDWQVQVKAPDPRRYAEVETVINLVPGTGAVGGITVPLTTPFSISTTGAMASTSTATNAGTVATRPVVTLYGPLVDPQIAHVTSGRSLSFLLTIASGDYLVVDFDKRTALLNGTASRSSALTATAAWWELAPGGNDLQVTAGGGDGTAEIRFRSAWL